MLVCTMCVYIDAGGLAVERWTCDHVGRGFNNLGQVVHTYVPLSPAV